jgi:hydrogenase large subunit
MFVTPGVVVDGALLTTDLVEINLGIRILVDRSFYGDWEQGPRFVTADPLGNPVDQHHPWNQTTIPMPAKRDFAGKYTWVMAPRFFERRSGELLALDTGGGPLARFTTTALHGKLDVGTAKATGRGVQIRLPRTVAQPEAELEWTVPRWNNALERDRARTYFQAFAAAMALHFLERARAELYAGRTATWTRFDVPDQAISCGFHEAVRGALSHHMVIRDGRIANYHPYPPTCWNASPRDANGVPGPFEDAVQGTPIFEENATEAFTGIDVMRVVRSFDPCMPCGVHMILGPGREILARHAPALGPGAAGEGDR